MARKELKVGLMVGGGPPPGYQWNVLVLDIAFREATKQFNAEQYAHIVMQVQELAREPQPSHSQTASIDRVEDFYELRDCGGVLGSKNARAFFGIDDDRRALVFVGAIHKQNNGATPHGDKVTMRRRWRKYRNGDYGFQGG